MERAYDFLKRAGIFYVATVSGEEPKVRPFGFSMIYKERLYFCTNNQKEIYIQLKENPNIEICACTGEEWIRIKGKAVFDEDMEAKKQVFIVDPGMNALYKPEDEIFEVFYLSEASVVFANMKGESETETFG